MQYSFDIHNSHTYIHTYIDCVLTYYLYVCVVFLDLCLKQYTHTTCAVFSQPGGPLQEIPVKAAPPEVKELEAVWYEFLGRTPPWTHLLQH